jgi:ParB/RepB/Spo0J family partition protein
MPKLEAASLTQKISLAQIIDTGNIREREKYGPDDKGIFPEEIRELAESIKKNGQIQPVIVKDAGIVDGVKQFELIAGFRRRAAFQYLLSKGDDFNMINASVVTGEKLVIQLVENIQRENLTSKELEAAVYQLVESGKKQTEIAALLSKSKPWVSIHVSAYKMRLAAEKAGIDMGEVETTTLGELLGIPDHDLIPLVEELVRMGGTRAVANALVRQSKRFKGKPETSPAAEPEPAGPPPGNTAAAVEPDLPVESNRIDPLDGQDNAGEPPQDEPPPAVETPPLKPFPAGREAKTPLLKKPQAEDPDGRKEADHRIVDVNDILTVIYDYMNKTAEYLRVETCKDLIALIHERLDRA